MFKQPVPIAYEIKPTRSHSILRRIIFILASGALLAPLAGEGAAICYVQWCEIMGKTTEVKTPLIDSIGSGIQYAREWLADSLGATFRRTIHDPTVALPLASGFLVLAMAMLRR